MARSSRAPGTSKQPDPRVPLADRKRTRSGRERRVKDNVTGYAFLIGAVLCFVVFS